MSMTIILAIVYELLSIGLCLGFLMENEEIPAAAKLIVLLISPITAPLMLGTIIGLIAFRKLDDSITTKK